MKPAFFVKEAFRSISRNAIPSFAAMASVLVTVLVLGVFIPVVQATTGAANEVRGRVLVDVYLKKDATKDDVSRVQAVLGRTDHVGKVQYVSKAQAYAQEKQRNPEAYELLGTNPLPDTFRVTPDKPDNVVALRNALAPSVAANGARTPIDGAIDQVKNRKDETTKILTATRVVKLAMGGLAALLIIASILLISNTIRLSLFSRRREVEVMKLVGATDSFIRWPFVIEGVVLGALGGIVAVLMLGIGKVAFLDPLASDFALIAAPQTIGFALLAIVLLVASVGVSAVGSSLSLRKFLRV
jgi:cell division transport system permease protein